ncbi:MAG: hypothetical protein KAQ85_08610 [Thermodesulfovibrionia bacterium]|nr:hypothetical protein [Thermodesulfovibrionia bacterium]
MPKCIVCKTNEGREFKESGFENPYILYVCDNCLDEGLDTGLIVRTD